jgi:hypothetical protein
MSIKRFFPVLLVMASAAVAHASPNDNFRLGTVVQVESATVDTGNGARTSTGSSRITKSGGSLDFTMRAADLGVELPISVDLRGSVLADGKIAFDIDDAYSPGVDLGGGQILSRVAGRITMRALPVLGIEPQDIGNVRLELAADSQLVAYGSWGSTTIAIGKLYLLGGIPQPALSTFTDPSTTRICSGRAPVYRQLRVLLTGAASATGASVELDELTDAGVHVPPTVVVRRGARTADLRARIEPGYVGRVRLTAAARGITRALDIDVRPAIECMSR